MTKSKLISSMYNYERHGHYRQADRIFNYLIKTAQEYVDLYSDGEDIDNKDIHSDEYNEDDALLDFTPDINKERFRELVQRKIYVTAYYIVESAMKNTVYNRTKLDIFMQRLVDSRQRLGLPDSNGFTFKNIEDKIYNTSNSILINLKKHIEENPNPKNINLFKQECIKYAYNHLMNIIKPMLTESNEWMRHI